MIFLCYILHLSLYNVLLFFLSFTRSIYYFFVVEFNFYDSVLIWQKNTFKMAMQTDLEPVSETDTVNHGAPIKKIDQSELTNWADIEAQLRKIHDWMQASHF